MDRHSIENTKTPMKFIKYNLLVKNHETFSHRSICSYWGGVKLGHPKARVYHFSGDYTE